MLLMGACIGRFWGLVAVRIATRAGLTAADFQSEEWAWIDPGVFAMVGAGAFMAGVSRLTLSLAVIVMEMTNEVHFLLPLLIAIMVAKWIADALEHALYHSLLELKNVPFLPSEPFGGATLDMLSVRDIMCQGPVICLREVRAVRVRPRLAMHVVSFWSASRLRGAPADGVAAQCDRHPAEDKVSRLPSDATHVRGRRVRGHDHARASHGACARGLRHHQHPR